MDKSVPYGVRAIRHLKKSQSKNVTAVRPNLKRQQVIEKTYDYFLREVDPIIGECITYLLCVRPSNVMNVMLEYLIQKKNGSTPVPTMNAPEKTSKAQRLFLATQISPVLTKLVNRIATSRPNNVIEFMCNELEELIKNEDPGRAGASDNPQYSQSVVISDSTVGDSSATVVETKPEPAPKAKPRSIQVILLGLGSAGKTSFVNSLQGNFDITKPTIGFRPTAMMLGADKVKFYDLGGSAKIRDIWTEYYHDVHGIVYVVDSTLSSGDAAEESVAIFHKTLANDFLKGKPVLLLANKQDQSGALDIDAISNLYGTSSYPDIQVAAVSCNPYAAEEESPEVDPSVEREPDGRIEGALEWLLNNIQEQFESLNTKVSADTKRRLELDAQKRAERERRVLRNKIMCAFPQQVDKSMLTADTPTEPEDVFTREESITFIAAEVGEEVEALSPEAIEVVDLVGCQRLAMQMVGALHAPVSKKKTPMPWSDVKALVIELRKELGLPETV